jgi:hypothetical protein
MQSKERKRMRKEKIEKKKNINNKVSLSIL